MLFDRLHTRCSQPRTTLRPSGRPQEGTAGRGAAVGGRITARGAGRADASR
jgi:hypothetical protein